MFPDLLPVRQQPSGPLLCSHRQMFPQSDGLQLLAGGRQIKAWVVPPWRQVPMCRCDGDPQGTLVGCLWTPTPGCRHPPPLQCLRQNLDPPRLTFLLLPFSVYDTSTEPLQSGGREITTSRHIWASLPCEQVLSSPLPPPFPPFRRARSMSERNSPFPVYFEPTFPNLYGAQLIAAIIQTL